MGQLHNFDLQKCIQNYHTEVLVETGTAEGNGVAYAAQFPFREIHSIEYIDAHVGAARKRFAHDPRIKIYQGTSCGVLEQILPAIKTNTVFWLDAHYPMENVLKEKFPDAAMDDVALPLQGELDVIMRLRQGIYSDVILVDDLRIYEEGPFTGGNLKDLGLQSWARFGLEFLKPLEKTHEITKLYHHEGYLVIVPRPSPSPQTKS